MVGEYRERGLGHLAALESEAARLGVSVERRLTEGPFLASVLRTAQECGVSRIYVARLERSHLSRLFLGNEVDRLRRKAPCPVELFRLSGQRETTPTRGGKG
jgi:nucleotide-binding universal stress UspA family protein